MNPNQHMQLSSHCAVCDAATDCSDAHGCREELPRLWETLILEIGSDRTAEMD